VGRKKWHIPSAVFWSQNTLNSSYKYIKHFRYQDT